MINPEENTETTEKEDITTSEVIENVAEEATENTPPEDELSKLNSELAELKEKYLRLYADFENFRRRTAKEKLELISTANEDLMKAILPVVDDFERAMASFEIATEIAPMKEGLELIFSKFTKTLEARGLKPMISKGETFDAELHESITQFPAPTEDLKGKVIDEVEKGYFLHEKVIRYAKVVVGS
ncbi:MAG: nucleotide exchange factor GrpE [Runella sp.]